MLTIKTRKPGGKGGRTIPETAQNVYATYMMYLRLKSAGMIYFLTDTGYGQVVIYADADQDLIFYLATPPSKVFSHPIKAT